MGKEQATPSPADVTRQASESGDVLRMVKERLAHMQGLDKAAPVRPPLTLVSLFLTLISLLHDMIVYFGIRAPVRRPRPANDACVHCLRYCPQHGLQQVD